MKSLKATTPPILQRLSESISEALKAPASGRHGTPFVSGPSCGCPLVHTYHTVYEDLTCYFSPNARLGRSLAVWFSRYVLSQTDAVIVPTDKIRNILGSYGVTRPIYTVPTGIDISSLAAPVSEKRRRQLRSSLGIGEEDIALTYVGRLAKEKHIDELIGFFWHRHPAI